MLLETLLVLTLMGNPSGVFSASKNLASHTISLEKRYGNSYVNGIFKDNILLTFKYLEGGIHEGDKINWDEVEKPFSYGFTLKPGETFAFHDVLLPEYKDKIVKTTGAHFNYQDGFKSDGYLFGDGVCHLASLIYWVAKDAGLATLSPVNHNFAPIPEVPKEYGVSIYVNKSAEQGANNNLYITNTKDKPVKFVFEYKNGNLTSSVVEEN